MCRDPATAERVLRDGTKKKIVMNAKLSVLERVTSMGWLDKVKEGVTKVAQEAEEMATIGKVKLEVRSLHGKMAEALQAIGAKAYDLYEAGAQFPPEVAGLCKEAEGLASQIKTKETEIEKIKA